MSKDSGLWQDVKEKWHPNEPPPTGCLIIIAIFAIFLLLGIFGSCGCMAHN
jgi:hypothetical protein